MIPTVPIKCKDKASGFLSGCDDIYQWFEEKYEKTKTVEESIPIPVKDLYDVFRNCDYYNIKLKELILK